MNNYINGFAYRESAWNRLQRQSGLDKRQWEARLEGLVERTADQNRELAAQTADRMVLHGDYSFEYGLNVVLDGIAARLARLEGARASSDPPQSARAEDAPTESGA